MITLYQSIFSSLVGKPLSIKEMATWLPWLGVDIEETGSDYVKIEFNPNRVDFSSHGGVARAFQGLMGWETGLPKHSVQKGEITLKVDPSVSSVRPYVVAAIVRNINLNSDSVKELMEIQEDLHWGVGRNRRKASIGVHNLNVVDPPFRYITSEPKAVKFIPLDKIKEMTLQEILERHEKGVAFKHHVNWAKKYPLIIDKKNRVLSFPPIINSELTRVSAHTQNLFIDVTGTETNAITKSLNVLVTALADMGGTIETVQIKYPSYTAITPDLTPQRMELRINYANKLLGLKLTVAQAIKALKKARLDARTIGNGQLEVLIPAYRIDTMHEIDLVEEVAIGYGYYKLTPTRPATLTTGKQHEIGKVANIIRQIMVGLGFIEVLNFILANKVNHYYKMRKKARKIIELANPVSTEYSIIRQYLLPSLMENLAANRHQSFPQKIFEVSDVVEISKEFETQTRRRLHIAGVASHPLANFSEIKAYSEALLTNMGLTKWDIRTSRYPSFLDGRAAAIYKEKQKIGVIGEIHPEVLNNFELENPTSAFEIDVHKTLKIPK